MKRLISLAMIAAPVMAGSAWLGNTFGVTKWSDEERAIIESLSLSTLGPLPADPSNRVADNTAAQSLGKQLFFDERLSGNGKVACATCHLPRNDFQDGIALAKGVGTTDRRTMPIAGTAHSPWMFWDGRKDSQWSQALGPLESGVEHGGNRIQYVRHIASVYRAEYERLFGRLPDLAGVPENAGPNADAAAQAAWLSMPTGKRDSLTRVFANMGKSIAAFERTITFDTTRFDRYVAAELAGRAHTASDSLSADEEAGLRLFIGKANCVNCHNGARLTDDHFHNTGVAVSRLVAAVDSGRATGARRVVADEFNCLSGFSDAKPDDCSELRFAVTEGPELVRAYKTPSLRNVSERAPFMHAGQIATLDDVVAHYDRAPSAPFGTSELKKLRLSEVERTQIVAYLRTLRAEPLINGERVP
jgi:cytochrome c peroxidase